MNNENIQEQNFNINNITNNDITVNQSIQNYLRSINNQSEGIIDQVSGLIFTKKCFLISSILSTLIIASLYCCLSKMDLENFDILRLETNDNDIILLLSGLFCLCLIICWNFFLFFHLIVFQMDFTRPQIPRTLTTVYFTFAEDIYKNPIYFITIISHFNSAYLSTGLDYFMWALISILYLFNIIATTQLFNTVDKQITSITNFMCTENRKIVRKMRLYTIFLLSVNAIFTFFLYKLTEDTDMTYKYILLGKGIYICLKHIELYTTREIEYRYVHLEMGEKEKLLIRNCSIKSKLEIMSMMFVVYMLMFIFIFADYQPWYFTIGGLWIIINQIYNIVMNFKKYGNIRDYYYKLNQCFPVVSSQNEECIICTEKLETSRTLECKHCFHLICLSKWLESGNKNCPLCRKDIDFKDNNPISNQNRIYSFVIRLNNTLFGWLPNISMRIVRNNEVLDPNINNFAN